MKFTNKNNLPQPYVDAVKNDDYDPGESDYTPSSLMKPPYMAKLLQTHKDEIEVDVADRFFAMAGQLAHSLLERGDKGKDSRVEVRIYRKVGNHIIGMQWDRLHFEKDGAILQDWKMTSVYKFKKDMHGAYEPVPEWETQLNIGAYILRKGGYFIAEGKEENFNPIAVKELQIVGLLRDFHQSTAKREPEEYPQHPVVSRTIPLWTDEQVEEYITKRAIEHDYAKDNVQELVPACTSDEMWEMPPKFAVMKGTNKRATKLFDREDAAENHAVALAEKDPKSKYRVDARPGKRNRCEGYCDAAPFCPVFKAWKEAQDV